MFDFFLKEPASVLDLDKVKLVGFLLMMGACGGMSLFMCSNALDSGRIWNSSKSSFASEVNSEVGLA